MYIPGVGVCGRAVME
ncbi:hypothetical protein E2C01_093534 [Portunus trituberculatus]|uniref:Uncharacterized protein n=1 Tax=Portunus trituberculatus TaxID=210409 RepID=A0A5B7JJE7_PORTR|nr:hypothetical protein [Portunus trituberculatus]